MKQQLWLWGKRFLYPGILIVLLLIVVCGSLLFFVFMNGLDTSVFAYAVYSLSAYTLAVAILCLPKQAKKIKVFLHTNKHSKRYLTDIPFRVKISLYLSLGVNLAYAVFKLISAVLYMSLWFGAVAVYYIVLSVMRFLMLRHIQGGTRELQQEYRQYGFCGCLLIALNLALTGVFYQMIHNGKSYYYPGFLIYAVAAYAFSTLTFSIVGLIRYRKLHRPAISAAKVIGLSAALVSMFTLQTAMFASFGGKQEFQLIMNSATGGGVCLVVFGMAVFMIYDANRQLKQMGLTIRKHKACADSPQRKENGSMDKDQSFNYTYSAKQQEEINKIRKKYIPREEDKMEQLRRLDESAQKPGTIVSIVVGTVSTLILGLGMCCTMVWTSLFVPGIIIGIVGLIGVAAAYPLYTHITKKQREKLAPQIIQLSNELMQ